MEIYLEMVILLNFLVDFLLLLGTNRLSGFPPGSLRCALGAALGGVYAGACLLPGFRFLGSILWRMVSLVLMAAAAFGTDAGALRRGGLFLLLSMALGGLAVSFGRGDFLTLVLGAALIWLLCCIAFGADGIGREYLPVTLSYGGRSVSLLALRDSGNTLRDPVTGDQVLVVSGQAAQRLTGLSSEALAAPLETLAKQPLPGLRLIPYRTVGQGSGMLLALRISDVKIARKRQSVLVAFAPEGLGEGTVYQALAGGAL